MYLLAIRIIKSTLLFALLILFTSGKSNEEVVNKLIKNGSYVIYTTGDVDKEFKGLVDFETNLISSNNGGSYNTLRLNLKGQTNHHGQFIQFLISKEHNEIGHINNGTYKVEKEIEGFINCFNGVFGFANGDSFGEYPFFANKGRIKIEYINKNTLKGTIFVLMRNADKKEIKIQGSFIANRKIKKNK